MSRRERFTPYEKEQACLDYINGNRSRSEICNCLHISTRTIQDWAAIYKKYGILGFTKKTKNSSYSKEFKMELVEKCISGEASSIDLGHQYDISSGLLRKWIRMYNANIELKDYNPKQGSIWQKQDVKLLLMSVKRLSIIVLNTIAIIRKRRHFMMFLIAKCIRG